MKKVIQTYNDQTKIGLEMKLQEVLEKMGVYDGSEDSRYPKEGVIIIEFIEEVR